MAVAYLLLAFVYVASLAGFPAQASKGGDPEAAKLTNPVATTPEAIAVGKKAYQRMCARCHGPAGKGDGSTTGNLPPSDLTDDVWDHGSNDGEIYVAVRDGTSADMDGYRGRLTDTEIWSIVNYLRSIGPQKP